jgi:hypothetical protein
MKISNLTPHAIVICLPSGAHRTYEPAGGVARCSMLEQDAGTVDGIPVVSRFLEGVVGLPEPEPGTLYLVGSMVLTHPSVQGRADVFAPDTGPTAIRENGQVVAVRRLVRA